MKVRIAIPSWKRADNVKTLSYLPSAHVFVDEAELAEYQKNYPKATFIACPKGVQGNISRVRNYILRQSLEVDGFDVVVIVDDDLSAVGYFEGNEAYVLKTEPEVYQMIEKYSLLAQELGVYHWGLNVNPDKQNYREYTPFSFTSYVGSPFGAFLKGNDCYYDERLPLKEDYDMTLQQLNKHRRVLRVNKYFYVVKQVAQTGGVAMYRNTDKERQQLELLQAKWGSKIVKIDRNDRSHNNIVKRKVQDWNPVLQVPIKGI